MPLEDISTWQKITGGSGGKASTCNTGDWGSIPGSGRSPGEGNGNPLQYPCLENSMDQRSLVVYSPWGHKELDTTERLHFLSFLSFFQLDKMNGFLLQNPCNSSVSLSEPQCWALCCWVSTCGWQMLHIQNKKHAELEGGFGFHNGHRCSALPRCVSLYTLCQMTRMMVKTGLPLWGVTS